MDRWGTLRNVKKRFTEVKTKHIFQCLSRCGWVNTPTPAQPSSLMAWCWCLGKGLVCWGQVRHPGQQCGCASLVPHNSCSQCGHSFFFFPRVRSSRFLRRCQPIITSPTATRKFQMEAKNNVTATVSTWTPLSRKTFLWKQAREASANTHVLTGTHTLPTLTMQYQVTQPTPTLVIPARNRE